jgi:hypothetical protein
MLALYRKRRGRGRRAIERTLIAICWLSVLFYTFAVMALSLPMSFGCQKL